ncbi:MAG: hypothetical protein QOE61_3702, partial [Micromonosporaceae bacterium]|nr:hypothetical protein [Micromonosporaceae bacterium]
MTDADDVIVLPVPETVRAIYLVPVVEPPPDPVALLRRHTAGRWKGDLGSILADVLDGPVVPVEIRTAEDVPPLPVELLAVMGASEAQLTRVSTASHFAIATAQSQPGWPPVHEWITRAIATVLAEQLGSDVVDVLNYQVLDTARASATLPDEDGRIRLADWVWVDYSPDRTGYWCTTTGLRRFGLPELQTLTAPPNVVEPWGQAMTGMAHRLLAAWSETLSYDREAAFVQLPSKLEVTGADVAVAYGRSDVGNPTASAALRLALDPGSDPEQHSFLTIHPPLSWSGSAGEHMADVCATLFGTQASDIRHAEPSESMDHAIAIARSGLNEIRERFESGQLDLHEKLLVKYALHAERGTEYLWAYVTSWRDPFRILGTSAADAVYHPKVRTGRPVVVDASSVVD